jgi:hypothetical protein
MAVKYLAGRTFYLTFSPDAGTSVYTAVCLIKQGVNRSRSVTKVDNQCEVSKAYGMPDRNMTVECMNNLTPAALAAGVGEASHKLFATWFEANTQLTIKRKTPSDGSEQYMESLGRIVKLDDVADVGSNQTFSLEVEFEGTFDETA